MGSFGFQQELLLLLLLSATLRLPLPAGKCPAEGINALRSTASHWQAHSY
jgi:hypothetical protein